MTEIAKLLTVASTIDNRTVAPETVMAWHRVIGYLDYETAQEAVLAHFGESTEYLLPKHVKDQARRIRERQAREARISRPAIDRKPITLNREAHEAEFQAALAVERARRAEAGA